MIYVTPRVRPPPATRPWPAGLRLSGPDLAGARHRRAFPPDLPVAALEAALDGLRDRSQQPRPRRSDRLLSAPLSGATLAAASRDHCALRFVHHCPAAAMLSHASSGHGARTGSAIRPVARGTGSPMTTWRIRATGHHQDHVRDDDQRPRREGPPRRGRGGAGLPRLPRPLERSVTPAPRGLPGLPIPVRRGGPGYETSGSHPARGSVVARHAALLRAYSARNARP